MQNLSARIDAETFTALISGKVVELVALDTRHPSNGEDGRPVVMVRTILADIGFAQMRALLDEAEAAARAKWEGELPEPCIIPPGEPPRP
jgi:hypothetical protein